MFKKAALEVASYGRAVANTLNTSLSAVVFNTEDCSQLADYGVDKVLTVNHSDGFNAKVYADIIAQAALKESANVIVCRFHSTFALGVSYGGRSCFFSRSSCAYMYLLVPSSILYVYR